MIKKKTFSTSMKILLISVMLIPALFLFSGCGSQLDDRATVDISGNFVADPDGEDLIGDLDNDTIHTNFENGFHITMDYTKELNGAASNVFVNMYGKYNTEGTIAEVSFKMTYSSMGISAYIKDGYSYANVNLSVLGSYKVKAPFTEGDDVEDVLNMDSFFSEQDLIDLFDENKESFDIEVSVNDTTTKYHIILNDAASLTEIDGLADVEIYYVFDEGVITGIFMSCTVDGEALEVSIVGFDGDIEYPDFSDYVESSQLIS